MKYILFIVVIKFVFMGKALSQIEGIVINNNKTVIIDAIIIATDSTGKIIGSTRSDKRGAYAFKVLKPNKYNVQAKKSGFQTALYNNIIITTPQKNRMKVMILIMLSDWI